MRPLTVILLVSAGLIAGALVTLAVCRWWLRWRPPARRRASHPLPALTVSLLTAVLDQAPVAVIVTDAHRRVLTFNTAAAELFRRNPATSRGAAIADVVREVRLATLLRHAAQNEQPREEYIAEILHGRTLLAHAIPIPATAESDMAMLLLVEDRTRLRHLELARRELVQNISHELRTPLASIRLLAETLGSVVERDPAASGVFIAQMLETVDHAAQLIEAMGDLSRFEARLSIAARERVDLDHVVDLAIRQLEPLAHRAGITMEHHLGGLPPIAGDADALLHVFTNVLHNATKFTPTGGAVTAMGSVAGEDARVLIHDTGPGIAPEHLPRVFERFYRGGQHSTDGAGLGLAICRDIVTAHGGAIWAESEPGQGTTIGISLPLATSLNLSAHGEEDTAERRSVIP